MHDPGTRREHDIPWWLVLSIAAVPSVVGLFLGGVVVVLGKPKDLTGGAVVLTAAVVTLFALADIDTPMKDDMWLRILRANAAILTAWVAVGAALARGLPTAWGVGSGVLFAGYIARRTWVAAKGPTNSNVPPSEGDE